MTVRCSAIRSVCAAGMCVAVTVSLLHAHDHPSHGSDALPPYEGDGYTAGAGGYPGMHFPAKNVHLLSWLPIPEFGEEHEAANDCWGYVSPSGREYAMLGLSHGTGFVEITNPGDPQIIAMIPGISSTWRDMKVYEHYAYIVSEGSGGQGGGIQVIDLSQIDDGIVDHINSVTEGGSLPTTRTHNVALDEESGYLYRCGGGSGTIGIRFYSLADPANPTFVGEWHERYVHDAQVVTYTEGPYAGMQVAFLYSNDQNNGGNPGLDILDVTDKSNIVQLGFTSYSFPAFSHQGWLNDDRTLVFLNDELAEIEYGLTTTTRVIDVSDLTNPFEVSTFTNGQNSIGHNIYIRDNLMLAANYRSGLRVFDLSTNPHSPQEVAFFNTFPEGDGLNFNSLWSNFPFYPSGVVIGSDIEKGLFVWWVGDLPLEFELPDGPPELLDPSGQAVRVNIIPSDGQEVSPGSAMLHYDIGEGEQTVELVHIGGNSYDAVFPPLPCGTSVSWYLSAMNQFDLVQRKPHEAPAETFASIVGYAATVSFADDFETDLGWTVGAPDDDATEGIWERANPVGTTVGSEQVQPDEPFVGNACYITGQHPGGGAGANDVDHGKTTLFSPQFDLSHGGEAVISYWRWYSNHAGANPFNDVFEVDISSDGGKTWVNVETVGPDGPQVMGGWYRHEFAVSSFVPLTEAVQVRFVASDYDPQALVEAAVDAFEVNMIDCTPPCLGDIAPSGGDGVVDVSDLLALLASWGVCPADEPCPADLNGDGVVDVSDLLALLGNWGACRE